MKSSALRELFFDYIEKSEYRKYNRKPHKEKNSLKLNYRSNWK